MIGMNVVFHLVSALVAALMAYLLIRMQRQRDLMRSLVRSVAGGEAPRRVHVESPDKFLGEFAAALAIPLEGTVASALPPCRIDAAPLMRLLLGSGLQAMRLETEGGQTRLSVRTGGPAATAAELAAISESLGGLAVRLDDGGPATSQT
jgi:hypothetical protein